MSVIRECLEIGLQAPTGSNRQGWHWVVVDDAEIRRRIGDVYREVTEGYLASGASAARLFTDDPQRAPVQRRVGDSVAWLAQHGRRTSARDPVHQGRQTTAIRQPGRTMGVSATRRVELHAGRPARGLGTAWTTLHLQRESEVAALLELPAGIHQGVLIPTAYYTGTTFRPAPRAPLDSVLHINRW
jgi:nitroreductase